MLSVYRHTHRHARTYSSIHQQPQKDYFRTASLRDTLAYSTYLHQGEPGGGSAQAPTEGALILGHCWLSGPEAWNFWVKYVTCCHASAQLTEDVNALERLSAVGLNARLSTVCSVCSHTRAHCTHCTPSVELFKHL